MAHCVCGPYNLGSYRGLKSQVVENFAKKLRFGRKRPLAGTFSKFCSERIHQDSPIHVLCVNFVEFGRPEIGKVVRHLPDKKAKLRLALSLSLLRGSRPKSARASGRQCAQSAPNFIQISSLATEA